MRFKSAIELMEETEEWIRLICDDKGNQKRGNMSPAMRLGIKRVRERVEKGEVVVVPTDKSGKFAIMPLEVYEEMGRVYTEGDTIINESELSELQRELNNHVKMFTKVFMGKRTWSSLGAASPPGPMEWQYFG